MKHLSIRQIVAYLLIITHSLEAKDWNFYRKNILQPTRALQFPLAVEFFGTIRNDSAWNSRTYLPGFVTDISAQIPTDARANVFSITTLTYLNEPGNIAQRPLTSIVNIAPLVGVKILGPRNRPFTYYAYIDSEFLPYGTYLNSQWFFSQLSTLLNTNFLINWAYVEGTWHAASINECDHTILIGQYSHPLTTTITFPRIVEYSQGAPIVPFALNPQLKYRCQKNGWSTNLTLYTQALYQDIGFLNNTTDNISSLYLRYGLLPGTNLTVQFANNSFLIGAGVNVQRLIPRISYQYPAFTQNAPTYSADESITNVSGNLYGMIEAGNLRYKWQGIVGQNGISWSNLIAYGITSQNSTNGAIQYANILYSTWWMDIEARCPNIWGLQPGLFFGYLSVLHYPSQLGLDNNCNPVVIGIVNSFGFNYQSGTKIAPRVWWYYHNNLHIGAECSYTPACFVTPNNCGQGSNPGTTSLLRFVVSTQYNF